MSCILHGVFGAAGQYLRGTVYTYTYAGRDRIVHVLIKKNQKNRIWMGKQAACCPAGIFTIMEKHRSPMRTGNPVFLTLMRITGLEPARRRHQILSLVR